MTSAVPAAAAAAGVDADRIPELMAVLNTPALAEEFGSTVAAAVQAAVGSAQVHGIR